MHLLYKKQGETCLECLKRCLQEGAERAKTDQQNGIQPAPVSMTYAGRLDPLAAGLLIVLEGDEIKEKEAYLGLKKTYEFEVVFGVATDTFDQLGVIVPSEEVLTWPTLSFDQIGDCVPLIDDLQGFDFKKLIGKAAQSYPFYSSKPIDGVPLFQYVKKHGIPATIPKLPTNEVRIYDIDVIDGAGNVVDQSMTLRDSLIYHIAADNLADESIAFARSASGDFRQPEIMESWTKWLTARKDETGTAEQMKIMKFRMTVSSGFYIRTFACWLGQMVGNGAIARNIVRTKIGDFSFVKN